MKLAWTSEARQNLQDILSHIGAENPSAARKLKQRIDRMVAYLPDRPFMARPGAIDGTREAIPHPSYRVVYQVDDDAVSILAVVHTSRQWPPETADED